MNRNSYVIQKNLKLFNCVQTNDYNKEGLVLDINSTNYLIVCK